MTISINAPGSLSDYDYSTAESRGDHSDLPADLINRVHYSSRSSKS